MTAFRRYELCSLPTRSKTTGRRGIPPSLRAAVIERDGYVCQLCHTEVDPADVHLDHVKPWAEGGKHTLDNLQVTHSRCNARKGAAWSG